MFCYHTFLFDLQLIVHSSIHGNFIAISSMAYSVKMGRTCYCMAMM